MRAPSIIIVREMISLMHFNIVYIIVICSKITYSISALSNLISTYGWRHNIMIPEQEE